MSTDRREFLGTLMAAGVLPLVGKSGGREVGKSSSLPDVPTSPLPDSADSKWDMSWTSRVERSKYRATFDSPGIADGGEIWRAATWKSQVSEVYGVTPEEVTAVLVIRHRGIPLVMSDAFWERHRIGKKRKVKDPWTGKTAERNPILSYEGRKEVPASMTGSSLLGFLKGGGIVLACNFAFGMMVHLESEADPEHKKEARERALAQLTPGVILQPSGFFGLLEAQRAGAVVFTPGEGA